MPGNFLKEVFYLNETPYEAMVLELKEEIGLTTVSEIFYVAETQSWYRYRLSERFRRYENGRAYWPAAKMVFVAFGRR
ncbi:hypothetical protein [Candidatus Coxiella mudrowiae]|uniref:hypothetical protein n=1 Tax=Candidatus Coxiella mudrowiae TaxID=2054173 RepID=UPI001FD32871|nr:hypothetical protein [Candidatus Coxiella mudrowiae]